MFLSVKIRLLEQRIKFLEYKRANLLRELEHMFEEGRQSKYYYTKTIFNEVSQQLEANKEQLEKLRKIHRKSR